ncbi:MAG: hypothetical protein ACE5F1_16500 [Planctomycetota bacterium]
MKYVLLSFVAGALLAVATLPAQGIPPLPVSSGCNLDTSTGWTSNNFGSVSTTQPAR